MSTATTADSENSPEDEPAQEICPGCQEVTAAINYALREHSNQRLWLKLLTDAYEKLNGDVDPFSPIKRLPAERDIALQEICKRITRIARSDLTDVEE